MTLFRKMGLVDLDTPRKSGKPATAPSNSVVGANYPMDWPKTGFTGLCRLMRR
jgi:hypothetical protein